MTISFRSAFLLLALASPAAAQGTATFDQLPEGFVGTSLVTPAGTFQDLVLDGVGTPGLFAADRADGQLWDGNRFTTPNVLGFGNFMPGPYVYPDPVQSFRILLPQPSNAIRFGLFLDNQPIGNDVEVEFRLNGQPGAFSVLIGTGAPGITAFTIEQCDNPGPYDEIRVRGVGPVDGGRFRGMIDTLTSAAAPCGTAPEFCIASAPGTCPCDNEPPQNQPGGCMNSWGRPGFLFANGVASLTVDEMAITPIGLPPFGSLILVQSTAAPVAPGPLGDGAWCLPGSAVRILSMVVGQSGSGAYPGPGNAPLSVRGNVTVPGTRHYQAAYRNGASFCTPAVFNATSGVSITWAP